MFLLYFGPLIFSNKKHPCVWYLNDMNISVFLLVLKISQILFMIVSVVTIAMFIGFHQASKLEYKKQKTVYLTIDSDFLPIERQSIYAAARMWEKATQNAVHFNFIVKQVEPDFFDMEKMNGSIWRASADDKTLKMFETVRIGIEILGYAPAEGYIILVPDRTNSAKHFQAVVAHELGHHIGLEHTTGVMNSLPRVPCISAHDLEQFCSLYRCDSPKSTCLER